MRASPNEKDGDAAHTRRARVLRGSSVFLATTFGLLSVALVGHHATPGGPIAGWSRGDIAYRILPVAMIVSAYLGILLRGAHGAAAKDSRWAPVAASVGVIAGFGLAATQSDSGLQALVLFWVMALSGLGLTLRRTPDEFLVLSATVSSFGLLLFGPEGRLLLSPRAPSTIALPNWGDAFTFSRTFPRTAPYVGRGGRLRENLRTYVARSAVDRIHEVRLVTNRLGLRNEDEVEDWPAGRGLTVLNLGDSFAIGFGVDQNAFMGPRLQERLTTSLGRSVRVWNAEVSDPCYGAWFLQENAAALLPDWITFTLSGNDLLQGMLGCGPGGPLQLGTEDQLSARPPGEPRRSPITYGRYVYPKDGDPSVVTSEPGAEPRVREAIPSLVLVRRLLGALHPEPPDETRHGELTLSGGSLTPNGARKALFDGFPNLGFIYRAEQPPARESYAVSLPLIQAMARRSAALHARFALVYFPQRHQVQPLDWDLLRRRWRLDELDFDLDLDRKRIAVYCAERDIPFVDLTPAFREAARTHNLYLPWEGHPNEAGHALAARVVAEVLGRATAQSSSVR